MDDMAVILIDCRRQCTAYVTLVTSGEIFAFLYVPCGEIFKLAKFRLF